MEENILPYQVYKRVFNVNENIDPFKIMKMLGVKDELYCLDLIQAARLDVINFTREKAEL